MIYFEPPSRAAREAVLPREDKKRHRRCAHAWVEFMDSARRRLDKHARSAYRADRHWRWPPQSAPISAGTQRCHYFAITRRDIISYYADYIGADGAEATITRRHFNVATISKLSGRLGRSALSIATIFHYLIRKCRRPPARHILF